MARPPTGISGAPRLAVQRRLGLEALANVDHVPVSGRALFAGVPSLNQGEGTPAQIIA